MRRGCTPCWIDGDGKHIHLERIQFKDNTLKEDLLQKTLHESPELLPVEELHPEFLPLVSLGREIDSIDNLFISPSGRLTIVETKLWRNPEATRQVVAQITDYATRLKSWSYSDLESNARKAMPPAPIVDRTLYGFISDESPEPPPLEPEFVDAVERNLNVGRFLLLIVGDGIRESVERMLGGLHQHPELQFSFGLVELQLFRHPDKRKEMLIVPQIVASTTEVVRGVIKIETTGTATVRVEVEREEEKSGGRRRTLTEEELLSSVADEETRSLYSDLLQFAAELGAKPVWRASSVSVQLPDPGGESQNLTLFVMTTGGSIYIGWLSQQFGKLSIDNTLARDYASRLADIFGAGVHPKQFDALARNLSAMEVRENYEEFTGAVSDFAKQIHEIRG